MTIRFSFSSQACELYDTDVIINQKLDTNLGEAKSEN